MRGAAALGEALMETMDLDLLMVVRFVKDDVEDIEEEVEDEDEGTAGRSNVGADWACEQGDTTLGGGG